MEIPYKSKNRHCAVTDQPLQAGDVIVSLLYADTDSGEMLRADVLADEAEGFEAPGPVLCRWRQTLRETEAQSEADLKRTALNSAEELFVALFAEDALTTPETDALKYLVAAQLERRRVLRPVAGKRHTYRIRKGERTYDVPQPDLTPETLLSIQRQLDLLVA